MTLISHIWNDIAGWIREQTDEEAQRLAARIRSASESRVWDAEIPLQLSPAERARVNIALGEREYQGGPYTVSYRGDTRTRGQCGEFWSPQQAQRWIDRQLAARPESAARADFRVDRI